jgi:hypothetical protein
MMIHEQKKKGSSTVFFIFLFSILQRTQRKTRDWTIGGYKTDNLGLIGKKMFLRYSHYHHQLACTLSVVTLCVPDKEPRCTFHDVIFKSFLNCFTKNWSDLNCCLFLIQRASRLIVQIQQQMCPLLKRQAAKIHPYICDK